MILKVAAKQPQFGGKAMPSDYDNSKRHTDEHMENYENYYATLMKFFEAIIKISAKTFIHESSIARFAMGEYGHTADGSIRLVSPFSELEKAGKLVVGFAPDAA